MSKVAITGNASGTGVFTVASPNSNTDRTLTLPDESGTVLTTTGTIPTGTANGVTYLNGSKVLTSGSALTFDGTNLGIGTSSPTQKLSVVGNSCVSSGQLIAGSTVVYSDGTIGTPSLQWNAFVGVAVGAVSIANTTGALGSIVFRNPNGEVGIISTSGSSTSYNTSSDYRLKEDWQPMTGATERVKALKPVNFAWKVDGSRVDGFLAHEAQEVVPECVTGTKDAVDAEGKPNYQGIDQSKLVPLLTAALQEALAKIDSLTARIEALETAP